MQRQPDFKVAPDEAVRLSRGADFTVLQHAIRIAKAFREQCPDKSWDNALIFTTLYNAGSVDGIRSERERKRGNGR